MKHNLRHFLYATIATLFCTAIISCKRTVEERLPGDWSYSETRAITVEYNNEKSTETTTNTGTTTFKKDGTGTFVLEDGTKEIIWEATADSVYITLNGSTIAYFVSDNSKDRQEWQATLNESGINYTFSTEITIVLTQ